jgi:hypothetical protein
VPLIVNSGMSNSALPSVLSSTVRRPDTAPVPLVLALRLIEPFFQPRDLLWDQMKPYIKPSEVNEVRYTLGNSLLDENEVSHSKYHLLMINLDFIS